MNEEQNRIFSHFPINKAHLHRYIVNANIKKPTYFGEMNIALPQLFVQQARQREGNTEVATVKHTTGLERKMENDCSTAARH